MRYPAYQSEHGIVATCPTTGLPYAPQQLEMQPCGDATFVSGACTWCDATGHTRGELGYRPLAPQIHLHELGDALAIGARVKVITRHDPHSGCMGVITGALSDDPRWKLVAFADALDQHSYAAHELEILDETTPRGA